MAENRYMRVTTRIISACLIATLLNILSMITVSLLFEGKLSFAIIYFSILWGTLLGAFFIGYWMESKGWLWGILIPLISMIFASVYHHEKISETILIYLLQIIPAGIVGEIGNRLKRMKANNSNI